DLALCGPPVERAPISTMYRGFQILTVPPPGGGVQLLLALNILAQLATTGFASCDEDWCRAIALTTSAVFRIRDLEPAAATGPMPLSNHPLWSESGARRLANEIAGGKGKPAPAGDAAEEPGDTTHLSVCDRYGNVVLLTQSIQSVFGAKVAHRDLGFLYNNYLCTCSRKPHPYALREGCRPRSNFSPTLVMEGGAKAARRVRALGAAGSGGIISATLQVLSAVIDRGVDVAAGVSAPGVPGLRSRKVWIERPA